ncbi:MAG TPA: OmpW family outer membrane protein [Stellaceae bacterium]|jgi:outer membrane protein OmpA-like peptidoglycan-associated protein|nr:OmpW family outer membrane protein [Stellaceae bacterium]
MVVRRDSLCLALATLALIGAGTAHAQTPGWYVGGEGAWSHLNDQNSTTTSPGTSTPLKIHPGEGFAAGANGGYEFGSGIRLEGELVYRRHDEKSATNSGVTAPTTGSIDNLAIMGNAYYDFNNVTKFTPYIGAGVGAARLHLDDFNSVGSPGLSADDWQLAYQGIAGVRYTIDPNWSASLDYRYFATTDPKFHGSVAGTPSGLKTEYNTHNVMLGVAYHFAPPPPPPPAAAPVPAAAPAVVPPPPTPVRQFTVYFEFDKSDLTPEGSKVVQDAAASYKETGSARIAVTGYTDLSGTQQYNLGLSKRRADTVRAALVRQGVPDDAISEAWRGKQDPAVPTPDGVREPRNRRVEIVI